MRFIGRIDELNRIRKIINNSKQSNILVYGRRRIGKSYLIKKAIENYNGKVIHYQCKNIKIENTLVEISNIFSSVLNLGYNIIFKSIEDFLDAAFNYKDNLIVILDEYSYLIPKVEGLNSIIQNKIDMYKFESNIKLILSGSQIDLMKDIVEYKSPLYGRFDDIIELKEHNYLEASEYYPNFSNEDKVMLYSVFGGEPLYNSMIDSQKSAKDNIIDLIVKENSFIELSIQNMLITELSKISFGNDVLQQIALGVKKNDDLVNKTHAESPAHLNHTLTKLLNLGLIKKISPINDENNKKKTMYFINNNPVRFYYKYLYKNLNERNIMDKYVFYSTIIEEDFETKYIPNVFEDISRQFLILKNKKNLINPPFTKIGTYWYDDKNRKINVQFDVVTYDKKGYIFYEVKYTKIKVDEKVIDDEIRQLSQINLNYYNLGFISKKGFDVEKNRYIFITLKDIYEI